MGYFELDESYTNYTGRVVGVLNEPREGVAPFFWKGPISQPAGSQGGLPAVSCTFRMICTLVRGNLNPLEGASTWDVSLGCARSRVRG